MSFVRPKKHLGQHFLTDKNISAKIVASLSKQGYRKVLEVGPGTGALSDFLFQDSDIEVCLLDIDTESISFLKSKYQEFTPRILEADFLKFDFTQWTSEPFAVIGNFPYNISSQIVFKILENKAQIPEMVGMFQKEVAERCGAKPRTKAYGILSVLLQAYYDVEYLFTVKPGVFNPPPKVDSAVIRIVRKQNYMLNCDEKLFWRVVKAGFNQRRKTLRNALGSVFPKDKLPVHPFLDLRAEVLSVADFEELTNLIQSAIQ